MCHVEYAAAESLGPLQATCAEMAGQTIVAMAASEKVGDKHQIYRRTGTGHDTSKRTSVGYHQNLLTPPYEDKEIQRRDALIMGSYLATRVIWAGSGMVDEEFVLSQKAHDVSRTRQEIVRVGAMRNRITERDKPLLSWSTGTSGNIESHAQDWERLEIRYADAVHSPWARFMSMATASLVLRICENSEKFDANVWSELMFESLPSVVQKASADLSFKEMHKTQSGHSVSPLEMQRKFATMAIELSKMVDLPEDEVMAAHEWLRVCDDLEQVDIAYPETLKKICDRVEWAARYLALRSKVGASAINRNNKDAVNVDLAWDQIYPHSFADDKVWRKKQPNFYAKYESEILNLMLTPPRFTRAYVRGSRLSAGGIVPASSWIMVRHRGRTLNLSDPYDYGD
jgi:hypothetical protein